MATWRRRAIELFPDLRQDLNRDAYGIYELFSDLRPIVEQAHAERDDDFRRRAYSFAAWCSAQEAKDLWNAAGVSFYEHAFDRWDHRRSVVPWLSPEVIASSWPLWELQLSPDQLAELRQLFANRREHKYRECA